MVAKKKAEQSRKRNKGLRLSGHCHKQPFSSTGLCYCELYVPGPQHAFSGQRHDTSYITARTKPVPAHVCPDVRRQRSTCLAGPSRRDLRQIQRNEGSRAHDTQRGNERASRIHTFPQKPSRRVSGTGPRRPHLRTQRRALAPARPAAEHRAPPPAKGERAVRRAAPAGLLMFGV